MKLQSKRPRAQRHSKKGPPDAKSVTREVVFLTSLSHIASRDFRRMMWVLGYRTRVGIPSSKDHILVWGQGQTARRALWLAQKTGAQPLYIEEAFLRGLFPGRIERTLPLGFLIDRQTHHFDPSRPSELTQILAKHPLDDPELLQNARDAIVRIISEDLSKYCATRSELDVPKHPFVLVVDQAKDDASVRVTGGTRAAFLAMLKAAREEYPNHLIAVKTHPETRVGARAGYFERTDLDDHSQFLQSNLSPWSLLKRADAVYCYSSQMGFEAILAGHLPYVFGQPFYTGWGLTKDRAYAPEGRGRKLSKEQLFAAAMVLYPNWYDPHQAAQETLQSTLATLEARKRAWHEDAQGWTALEMSLWKRAHLQKFFGKFHKLRFSQPDQKVKNGSKTMIWANKATDNAPGARLEDGFLRSRGLGANLTPPLSLILDDLGIYYDPTRISRLDTILAHMPPLRADQIKRAEALQERLLTLKLSKYNLPETCKTLQLPQGQKSILVPGQVEDDASIKLGTTDICSNLALIERVRHDFPDAYIIYKPHPDVEAGLRPGYVPEETLSEYVNEIAHHADPITLIEQIDEVATMTSLLGFEAMLREKSVRCYGLPFYAGWGLTQDHAPTPYQRGRQLTLTELIYGALITYPRYFDPIIEQPCSVETVLERLANTPQYPRSLRLRALAKLQGFFASYAYLWRD